MIDIIGQFCIMLGIALWLPAPVAGRSWLGARFTLAGYVAVIYLFVGNVLLSLPVSALSWLGVVAGTTGLVIKLCRATTRPSRGDLVHPLFVFTALFFTIALVRGGLGYQPYLGDELSSWLNLSRQIYLADQYWSSLTEYPYPSYTDGWPLVIAAANSVYGEYSDAHAVPFGFFLHLGIVAFTYDLVCAWSAKARSANTPTFDTTDILVAWCIILMFLAGEVTWRLLPTDLLIEQPLLYCYAACFLIALAASDESTSPYRLAAYFGLTLTAGYLFKVSMLAMAPTVGIFTVAILSSNPALSRKGLMGVFGAPKRMIAALVLTFGPTAAAIAIWTFAAPGGDQVSASVGNVTGSNWTLLFSSDGWAVTRGMLAALSDYCTNYKVALTSLGLVVLLIAVAQQRWRPAIIGFVVFCTATWFGLYLYYLYREPWLVRGVLESFPRFVILPLRILHFVGLLILTSWALRFALPYLSARRSSRIGLAVLVAAGIAWQTYQIVRSASDIADRRYQDPGLIAKLQEFRSDLAAITAEIDRRTPAPIRVGVIDQNGYGLAMTSAVYYSLKTRRDTVGSSYRDFTPQPVLSADQFDRVDLLWPVSLDQTMAAALARSVDDPACAAALTDYILRKTHDARFICLPKAKAPSAQR